MDAISRLGTSSAGGLPAQTLGQAEFLRLLTTQLMNQSPLNPVDNEQFIAQMAQFSTVSGIAEMSEELKAITAELQQSRITDAAAFVGRTVLVAADEAKMTAAGEITGIIVLPEPSDGLSIDVLDEAGTVIDTVHLGPRDAGEVDFAWSAPAPGKYRFRPQADDAGVALAGRVTAVATAAGVQRLSLENIGAVSAEYVLEVRE